MLEGSCHWKALKVSGCVFCVRGQGVGAMKVKHSPLATTAPGHGETPGGAEPCPLLACEGPGDCFTHDSHETAALTVTQLCGQPGPTNVKDSFERTKSRRRRGPKNTSTLAELEEAPSPPETSREEEETIKARDKGDSWGEVLVEY